MLKGVNITKKFNNLIAVNSVSFEINRNEIIGLIGPNGAGKTTLLSLIAGTINATSGNMLFENVDINKLPTHERVQKGIAKTHQIVKPFENLTVADNIKIPLLFTGAKVNLRQLEVEVDIIVELFKLKDKKNYYAKELNLATKKRLEVARAIATKPKLILLDEVMAGLNLKEIDEMLCLLSEVKENYNLTVVVVEHIIKVIMSISERIIVLNYGEKIADGTPQNVINNPAVIEAYLGHTKNKEVV